MADTTVYSIYAGYIPQISKGESPDFRFASKFSGLKKFPQGNRYSGWKKNLNEIQTGIHTDGKLGAARVRGSIAWYEYSGIVSQPDVTKALTGRGGKAVEEEIQALSKKWYGAGNVPGFNKSTSQRNKELLQEFERIMNLEPSGGGETVEGGVYGEPEEQPLGAGPGATKTPGQWKPDDKDLRDKQRIFGANAIDIYFRDAKGRIHRLDVTAQSMDDKEAHHGLGTHKDRADANVTGQQLLATLKRKGKGGGKKGALADLHNYFEDQRTQYWNPPIKAMKEIISESQLPQADILKELKNSKDGLRKLRLEADSRLEELIKSMRGKGVEGTGTREHYLGGGKKEVKETYAATKKVKGVQQVAGEHIGPEKRSAGWQASANAIRRWYLREAGKLVGKPAGLGKAAGELGVGIKGLGLPSRHGKKDPLFHQTEAMNEGLKFALHMLGNVMELFRSDSARKGGYSTAYTMGEGGGERDPAAANFVIEVKHTISHKGEDIFEFMKLKYAHIIIHNEAALSSVYQKALWYGQKEDAKSLIVGRAIRQNQLATLQAMGLSETGLRLGDVVALAHAEGAKVACTPSQDPKWTSPHQNDTHAASAKILPKKVNDSIDLWLKGVTGTKGKPEEKIMPLIKRMTRQIEPVRTLAGQREASIQAQGHEPGLYNPRQNKRAVQGEQGIIPSQSLLNKDPLKMSTSRKTGVTSLGNLGLWAHGMRQKGTGKVKEAALRARMGMDGGTRDKEWMNAQKFLFGDDKAMQMVGKSMVKGVRRPMKARPGDLTFWATPYLSIAYPATQVRVK